MESEYIVKAIRKLKPNSEFSFTENDYATIKWDVLQGTAPTESELKLAIEQVKADELAQTQSKANEKAALLEKLGITADEAALLLS
jgi:hypothetical protein